MRLESLSKILLVVSVISLTAACGKAPKITTCQSDPAKDGLDCVDWEKKTSFLNYDQSGNYVCLSPPDTQSLLEFCRTNDGSNSHPLKITLCISDPGFDGMDCTPAESALFFLPYPLTENYTCLSPEDARSLFTFCKTNDKAPLIKLLGELPYAQCQGPQKKRPSSAGRRRSHCHGSACAV